MTVTCPSCSARNQANARFCSSCGAPLRQPCPACGTPVPPDAAACPHCGMRLSVGQGFLERKTVTVLFVDLVGSTSVGERLDVETHQSLMTAYFEAMRSEAEAVGGTVEQFVGDAVLVLFGIPTAHDDDADRAVEASRRMLARLDELNASILARHRLHLEIRIGINTGEVVVPSAGTVPLGALAGDALNVAARLAGHAAPGKVLISEASARLIRGWSFQAVGSVELKGRKNPVAVFEVSGALHEPGRGGGMAQAPITGRQNELAALQALYGRAGAEDRPHLVTVYGPAGIGKSRLTAEFAAAAAAAEPPARVLFGRCRPYGEGVAFGALAEILAGVAGIKENDSAAEAAERIVQLVESLGGSPPPSTAEALSYAAGFAGGSALAGSQAGQVSAAIRSAWSWLLERLATDQPVVVILEDLHWADPALLELIEHVVEQMHGTALIVCPARPGLSEDKAAWGGGRQSFSSLVLEPLAPSDGMRMIAWYLGDDAAEAIGGQILERAEGNPYFIEEIIRGLVDEGSVVRDGSVWRVAGGIERPQIPQSVQAVISARIDLLGTADKRVLQSAAVIGRTFWIGAVAHLLGVDVAEVESALGRLEVRDLVVADVESVLSNEREYRFKHALVRDVAYNTLSRRDRSGLHRGVADWLGTGSGGSREVIALEAHHLASAYDGLRGAVAEDVDAEGLRSRALWALLQASESARRRVALGQARHFAREARRFAESPDESSQAAEALGEAYFFAYQGDAAWRTLREAVELRLDDTDEPDPEIARLCARALLIPVRWPGSMQTRPDEVTVLRYLHLGMDHALRGSEDAVRLLILKGFWQHAFPRAGRDPGAYLISPEESLRSGEQAVAAAAVMNRPDLESAALDAVTGYYISPGLYSAARPHTRRRLTLIDRIDDLWEVGDTYAMQGWVGFHLGEYREAARWSEEGYVRTVSEAPSLALQCLRWRALARFRLGDWDGVRRDLAIARNLLGEDREDPADFVSPMFAAAALVHEYRGEHVAADSVLELLAAHYERRSLDDRDPLPLSQWAEYVAPILVRRGRRAHAWRLLEQSQWRRRARRGVLAEAALEVAAEAGDWDAGPALLEEARGVAAEGGLLALPAAADAFEGLLLRAQGELGSSIDLLERAAAGFDRIEAIWDAARTRLELATTFVQAGFDDAAEAVLAVCLPVLEGLKARREFDAARELAHGS